MTLEAQQVLKEAELIIGARRMVEAAAYEGQDTCMEYDSDKICSYIEEHPEYEKTAVVLSGDVGFYSGARNFWKAFGTSRAGGMRNLLPGVFHGKNRQILG